MILHLQLDKEFNPYDMIQNLEYESFIFNGGETHIKIKPCHYSDRVLISTRINGSNELMQLIMAVDAIKRYGVDSRNITLCIPYLPYARQDRICVKGEAFSLKVFADIINCLNVGKVTIFDCHSDVGAALINNCENIPNHTLVKSALYDVGDVFLVSPDAGANKKVGKLSEYLGGILVVNCDKVRDPATGRLSGFKVFCDDLNGKDCLIVDDICDGGRTFIGIADELKKKNAGKLYLFVTHGIFSNGYFDLGNHFEKLYCSDSVKNIDSKTVKQINIKLMEQQ